MTTSISTEAAAAGVGEQILTPFALRDCPLKSILHARNKKLFPEGFIYQRNVYGRRNSIVRWWPKTHFTHRAKAN